MHKFLSGFLVVMFAFSAAYAIVTLQRTAGEASVDYRNLEDRLHTIIAIRPQLTSMTDRIWQAISAYDPKSGKKVSFLNNIYFDSFTKWDAEVKQTRNATGNVESRRKLDVLERSLRVLSRRVYSLDDDSIKKILSDDIFSDDSETKAKDVYTDRMQKTMGQIRLSVAVINTAICEYAVAATGELEEANRVAAGKAAKIDRTVHYFFLIGSVFCMLSLVAIACIKKSPNS